MNQFKNIQDVINYFSNEDKCRDTLERMRFPDGRIACPKCGVRGAWRKSDMRYFRCRDKKCSHVFSITVGTVMEGSKLPLSKWFTAIYLITAHKKGISSCQLARDLGIGQKAAWFMNHRIRLMLKDKANDPLSGVTEIDECYVGGRWANMSKKKRAIMQETGKDNKTAVMGMVQRDGRAKLTLIGANTFKEVVRKNVDSSAVIITDEHRAYKGLSDEYLVHESINHSVQEYVRDGFHTNSVEGFFSLLKRQIFGIHHQVSPKHLQRYCDEMAYRFNSRKIKDVDRFVMSLKQTAGRLKWHDLIAKPKGKWDFDKPENK